MTYMASPGGQGTAFREGNASSPATVVNVVGSRAFPVVRAINAAGRVRANKIDMNKTMPDAAVVLTDPEDEDAVCNARCESTLVIDPVLVSDDATIASLAAAWLGKMEWNEPFPENYHGGA